jgi:hypothetical protein
VQKMAIYHLNIRNISRGKGRSAIAAAAYRAGERLVDARDGRVSDYRNKREIDHTALLVPSEAQGWVHGRERLWNAVETAERRSDARLAKEVNIALPVELSKSDQIALAEAYGRWLMGQGLIVDVAVHGLSTSNPHFHAMFTTRELKESGFGKKHRWLDDKAFIVKCRQAWTEICNAWLGKGGRPERVDERSLRAQGLTRKPTLHRGVIADKMLARGRVPVSKERAIRSYWGNERMVDYRAIDGGLSRTEYNARIQGRRRELRDMGRAERDWHRPDRER